MASEEELTSASDSLDTTETHLPEDVLDYVRDQVVDYIKKTEFSAKIQHTQGQSPKLVLSFGNLRAKLPHKPSDTKNTNTILVEKVPPTADEDLLEMFFESTKKYGGGPVTKVRIIRNRNIAYVTFREARAVETVMKKKPIMLGTTELALKPFKNLLPGNETITRVDVMGLLVSKDFTEGLLEEYTYPPPVPSPVPTYGPELAALMKVGTRVVRGRDWIWEDHDGGGKGQVIKDRPLILKGWIWVKWDNGNEYIYRMGAENCYDLQIAPKE